jgi:hypothetical protein
VAQSRGQERLAHTDSDGERLQQLRNLLPTDVNVVAPTHPLCGARLAAIGFKRKRNELLLVVVLPDGTPGMIVASATDVLGERAAPDWAPTPLSVEGLRRLRTLIEAHAGRHGAPRRPRPWKVVRHKHGVDPLHCVIRVYSSHTTEPAARRARDRERSAMVRASGYEAAARWEWSVVHDRAGLLVVTAETGAPTDEGNGR